MENSDVDGYIVGEFIGRGSFGIVHKATKDGNTYAIKLIDMQFIASAYDNPKRLDREIEALKRIKSSYTVEYVADGYFTHNHVQYKYIVMEYIEGQTVSELIATKPLPWSEDDAKAFIIELVIGIDEVHKNSIVHRDLKLDNIAMCSPNQLKIIDYGLSKIIDFSRITKTGTQVGAPYYMSPEQIMDGKNVTYVADYYAIGVILYLLTTGKLPFESTSAVEIAYKTVHVKPATPASINPTLSTAMDNTIMQLLEKEPIKRFSSTADIIASFDAKVSKSEGLKGGHLKFYPRLMPNEATIMELFLEGNKVDGVDFPVHSHSGSKKLIKLLRDKNSSIDFFGDPGTSRLAFSSFSNTKSLQALPYAPSGYDPLNFDDFDTPEKVKAFARQVIDFQIATGCSVVTAPFFYFDNTGDDWFDINIQMIRASTDYVYSEYPGYKLCATVCTNAETLTRPRERAKILEHYGHAKYDFCELLIDKITEKSNASRIHAYIEVGLALKGFTKAQIIAGRVPAVAQGLLSVGFDAFTSGLAVLDSFERTILDKEGIVTMPIKHYFSDLLLAVPVKATAGLREDVMSYEQPLRVDFPQHSINLQSVVPEELRAVLNTNNGLPKMEFLFTRGSEIADINSEKPENRPAYFDARLDKAIDLRRRLIKQYGVKIESVDGLLTWKKVLADFK